MSPILFADDRRVNTTLIHGNFQIRSDERWNQFYKKFSTAF